MSFKTEILQNTECWLHVYNRGVDRSVLFYRHPDYQYFVELMSRALNSSGLLLVLYVLMPNHVHLVLKQPESYAVSHFMKSVCEKYAKYINRFRHRSGHLFQDRFKVEPVEDPGSLLRISRYIHFNPVEAGLTKSILDWRYSSGRIYAGAEPSSFVSTDQILSLLGGSANYLRFLEEYDPADPQSVWRFVLK